MTEPAAGTRNIAESGSIVGVQAGSMHNSSIYIGSPDATPRERFAAGVRYLDAGMPTKARELIDEAISRGFDTSEVRFHWVLATLSRRSYQDLSTHEAEQLARMRGRLPDYADDGWKEALTAACAVLEGSRDPAHASSRPTDELNCLPPAHRTMILRHLDLALTGGTKNHLWTDILDQAKRSRFGNGRQERVWAYFQPEPAPPKPRVPADAAVPVGERLRIAAWSALWAAATGGLAWSALVSGSTSGVLAGLLALPTGYLGFRTGLDWYHRRTHLEAGERAHNDRLQPARTPDPGLPKSVHSSFEFYAYKYRPSDVDVDRWIAETAGIRNTLSEEISDCYRDSGFSVKRINWLIRYLVQSEVRDKWKNGTMYDHHQRYRTAPIAKVACAVCCTVSALSVVTFLVSTAFAAPLLSALLVPVALVSGPLAATRVFHVLADRRTVAEQQREYQRSLAPREAAYERWREKLRHTCP